MNFFSSNCFSICIFWLAITSAVNGFTNMASSSSSSSVTAARFTVDTYAVCAIITTNSPSPVTNCRRRRQYWMDVPLYLALNDGAGFPLAQFLNPTEIYQVEPTVGSFKTNPSAEDQRQVNRYNRPNLKNGPGYFLAPSGVVQPSWSTNTEEKSQATFTGLAAAYAMVKSFSSLLAASKMKSSASAAAATTTRVTAMKTFTYTGCRPASLPIPECQN